MKKILLTGGAGFIGTRLISKLVEKNYEITVLDNLSPQIHGKDGFSSPLYLSVKDKVNFVLGDVRDKDMWLKIIKGQDAIIHLASETGTGQSMYEVFQYVDVNINGTALMLDTLLKEKHNIQKIVLSSSRAIYGEGRYRCEKHGIVFPCFRNDKDMSIGDFECKCPICHQSVKLEATNEESKIHPISIYGITKQVQEQLIQTAGLSLNIPTVIFRYQNVYGIGQSLSNPYTGILSIFSTRILNQNKINIFEDGKESRDFVFVEDIVDATILGLEKENANNEVFNVGTGRSVDVLSVANELIKNYNIKIDLDVTGNYRVGDIRHNFADISKISKLLGYSPKYSFEKGIVLFCDWVNTQSIQNDQYDKTIKELKRKGLYK